MKVRKAKADLYFPGLGATKSNLNFAFCCRVSRLIDKRELVFESPMMTHLQIINQS